MTAAAAPEGRFPGGRFDDRFLRRLETLLLTIRRTTASRAHGARRSRRVGAGLEFADHRDYAPGDDPRTVDWNLFGRLQRLAVRLYEEDEDLSIDVLVDASASMASGAPPKIDLALQVGAALGYVGLANLDRVAVVPLGDGQPPAPPPARGKPRIVPMLRRLDHVRPAGATDLQASLRGYLARRRERRHGLAVVISDFYDPAGHRPALDLLRHHRLEVAAIQVSAPDEIAPTLAGDVRVRDVETGETRDLTVTPAVRAAAARRHAALRHALAACCRERGIPSFAVASSEPFDAVVLRLFRAGGLLG